MDGPAFTIDDLIERERACGVQYGPFWQHKYLDRAPEAVRRSLDLARRFPGIVAARNYRDTPVQQEFPNFSGIAAVTSATETNLWDPAIWTRIPANEPSRGCGYRVSFGGIYGNRATSSPASTWRARWGNNNSAPPTGTLIGAASNTTYMGAATTAKPFYGEFTVTILTVGATGTCVGQGVIFRCSDTAATWKTDIFGHGGTATTIDTTVEAGIGISHVWSATNASNTLTCQWAVLQALS